ncbi:MAG: hypothetical protein O2894_02650 [Planctomycetota bacterium]|nr:hypothetical protein [Planctomycetota bacterium]
MAASPEVTRRLLIRGTLVAGVLLAALGLWAAVRASPLGREAAQPALLADTTRYVRIRGAAGEPVPGAEAFVMQREGGPAQDIAWHPDVGVLVLPEGGGTFRVRVTAPGHKVLDFPAVNGGQSITLVPGLAARVPLRGVPSDGLPEHARFLLRVTPRGVSIPGLSDAEIVELMGNLGAEGSGPEHVPRGEFGYAVSRAQALAGLLLPAPGRYHVRWGLIDVRAGTWFSLGERSGREFDVRDTAAGANTEPQSFPLDVTLDDLQATLDGLAHGVEAAKDLKSK